MSYTEIYGFDQEGAAYLAAEIKNSHRGAMAIWRFLEEKYLPGIYRPSHVPENIPDERIEAYCGYKPTRCNDIMNDKAMKEIWNLYCGDKTTRNDNIVLGTTFDRVIIRKSELPEVIKAFNEFEGETSLKEQAEVLSKMYEDEKCVAVGWNQTSINGSTWVNYGYNEDTDESIPYNLNKGDIHWFLFDETNEDERYREGENE
jgi:hypothetical protein